MKIKSLINNGKTLYYINTNNEIDSCQFDTMTPNGKIQILFRTSKEKFGKTCLPSHTVFWTSPQEAQQHLNKILKIKQMKLSGIILYNFL